MKEHNKAKAELLKELSQMRKCITELEKSEVKLKKTIEESKEREQWNNDILYDPKVVDGSLKLSSKNKFKFK